MNSKIIYLSTFLPRSQRDEYIQKVRNASLFSADTYSYALQQGLSQVFGQQLYTINVPPIGYYPTLFTDIKTKPCIETIDGNVIESIGMSTVYIYQKYSIYTHTLRALKKQLQSSDNAKIIVYGLLNTAILKAAFKLKELYPKKKIKIVSVIPDFPEDVFASGIKGTIKKMIEGDAAEFYSQFDGFVYLTEAMKERTGSDKPYCIIEGIYNSTGDAGVDYWDSMKSVKTIFYAGMLYEKFGVKTLIDAFTAVKDDTLKLQLCGTGELVEYINELALKDPRIEYLGMIPREKAVQLQKEAFLLVNPRTPEGDFTKYSFPSKNIEYLASGTPTLLYQLPGIPAEYYNYCFSLKATELSVADLRDKILEISSFSQAKLSELASTARQFILSEKNPRKQCLKIDDLFSKI